MRRMTSLSIVALAALAGGATLQASAQDIRVQLNGDPVRFYGAQPREMDGRVLVPLRGVLEKMGAVVDWDAQSQTVTATKGNLNLELPIGSRTAHVNDRTVNLDVPAMTMGGYTMVPLRFVSEALGAEVTWSGRTNTVLIDTNGRIARNDREFYRGDNDRYYDRNTDRNYNRDYDRNYDRSRNDRNRRFSRATIIEPGTVIPVRLDDDLSSNEAREGDRFTATVESGRDDAGLPNGTKIEGVVTEAVPSRNGKPGVLAMEFRRIIFPDHADKSINAHVVSLDSKGTTRDSSGRLVAKSSSSNDQLKWVGIGAGAGLLISTLTKGNVLVDTILGGGAGYLYNQLQRKGAGNVNLRSGTEVGVKLDRRISFNGEPG